eukprot:TRINITY_DN1856_c0_g1_i7.p1 TRINITY_DN1856_c0_g1~~TRINITY_DN1856_c0_g1_i7.p1  ORF type:complete len:492 (-),score=78.62 TRINITY_DN1856_c0_g1_i7:204-1679(-)
MMLYSKRNEKKHQKQQQETLKLSTQTYSTISYYRSINLQVIKQTTKKTYIVARSEKSMDLIGLLDSNYKGSEDTIPMTPISPSEAEKMRHSSEGIHLTSISNFREIGGMPIENSPFIIRYGMLFRSGAPTWSNASDTRILLDQLHIKTLVDFRTSYETKSFTGWTSSRFEDNFVTFSVKKDPLPLEENECPKKYDDIDPVKEEMIMEEQHVSRFHRFRRMSAVDGISGIVAWASSEISGLQVYTTNTGGRRGSFSTSTPNHYAVQENTRPSSPCRFNSQVGHGRKHYNIPLINNNLFFEGVYSSAPSSVKMKCSAVKYLGTEKIGALFLIKHLNDMGIFEMYRLTLEYTKQELLTIFRVLKNPDNYPIMIFCSLGKDRTGMVTALLLSCLGVPRDIIVRDYHLSEENLAPNFEKIRRYLTRIGFTKEEFALAPEVTLLQLLNYIDQRYGTVSNYLVSIGFTIEEQMQLKNTLLVQREMRFDNNYPVMQPQV